MPGPLLRLPPGCSPVSSPRALAFPHSGPGRRLAITQRLLQLGNRFRSYSQLLRFRPANLLTSPVVPTLALSRRAAEASTSAPITVGCLPRAADMLTAQNRAIGGEGTYTPPDRQPCRLLPRVRVRPAPELVAQPPLPRRSPSPSHRADGHVLPCRSQHRDADPPVIALHHRWPPRATFPDRFPSRRQPTRYPA